MSDQRRPHSSEARRPVPRIKRIALPYACSVADGAITDEHFLPVLYELDRRDEWTVPAAWIKANPSLGEVKKLDDLRIKVDRAKANPNELSGVLCKEFNIRETTGGAWLSYDAINNTDTFDMDTSFCNSVLISSLTTALSLIVCSMAGYAFAKYSFAGKNVLFVLLLMAMMVPGELLIAPQYLLFSKINWLNTYQVQIIPFVSNVFAMFMCRQFMSSLPNEMLEAARIDGAGHVRVFREIALPASSPALGALAIILFLGKWNDFLFPKMMIDKMQFKPLMVLLPALNDGIGNISTMPYDLVLAGCVLATVPLVVTFLCLQDKFLSSVTIGSVKG